MAQDNRKKDSLTIDSTLSLTGNLMLSILCLALILPAFIRNIHVGYPYILVCCAIQGLSIKSIVKNIKNSRPAIAIFPTLAFNNVLIYFTLFLANVFNSNHVQSVADFFDVFAMLWMFRNSGFLTVMIISLIVFVLGLLISINHSDVVFSVLFPIESIVLSLLFIWQRADKLLYGRIALAVVVVVSLVWIFICTYSNTATGIHPRRTSFYSFLFSCICFLYQSYMANGNLKNLDRIFKLPNLVTDAVARKMYPWWLVIILTLVFLICGTVLAFVADEQVEDTIESFADGKLFYAFGALAFLSKIILSNYFSYALIVYLVLLVFLRRELAHDIKQTRTKQVNKGLYDFYDFVASGLKLLYVIICFVFLINISENALYLTLPVALIAMYMLHVLLKNIVRQIFSEEDAPATLQGLPQNYHTTFVVLTVLLTASLTYHYRFSATLFAALAILLLTTLLVYTFLGRKLPENIVLPEIKTVKWTIAIAALIICFVVTGSSGIKTSMQYNEKNVSTQIVFTSKKRSTVESIEYQWNNSIFYDGYQQLITGKTRNGAQKQRKTVTDGKRIAKLDLPVKGEYLTVWVTDSNGVQTKRVLWYPMWFDARK